MSVRLRQQLRKFLEPMSQRRFSLAIGLNHHPGGLLKEKIEKKNQAPCDAAIIISIHHGEDNSYGQALVSMDGKTGQPLHPNDLFKAWVLMAKELTKYTGLDRSKVELCNTVFNMVLDVYGGPKTVSKSDI